MEQITSGKESVVNKKWDDAIDRFMSNAGVQDDFGSPKFQATLAEMESNRARELGNIHSQWGMAAAGADEGMHQGRIGNLRDALYGEQDRVDRELGRHGAAIAGADQQYSDFLNQYRDAYYQPYDYQDRGTNMMLGGIGSTINPMQGMTGAMAGLSNVAQHGADAAANARAAWGPIIEGVGAGVNWYRNRGNTTNTGTNPKTAYNPANTANY